MTKKSRGNVATVVCGFVSVGGLWLLWELAARWGSDFARTFPPPSRFLPTLADSDFKIGLGAQAVGIHESILSSMLRVLAGLAIGFVAAIPTGFVICASVWSKRFILPIIQVFAPIAPIAWIPLALVLFGVGNDTALFIVFMGVYFTLTIASVQAIEDVPERLIAAARTLGATRARIWSLVIMPYILPQVFTILRLNFIAAWMAVLAAEMTGLRDGLGAVIMIGRNLFNNELILLGMSLIGLAGFVVDFSLSAVQRRFFWWGDQ